VKFKPAAVLPLVVLYKIVILLLFLLHVLYFVCDTGTFASASGLVMGLVLQLVVILVGPRDSY